MITVALVVTGILLASAILAVFRIASSALTALSVGVVFALALDPVLRATQRRLRCSRAVGTVVVGLGLALLLGGTLLLLGPPAADQASDFADELPATIEEFYTWPVIGEPLQNWDAIGRAERFVDDLPERIDADWISDVTDRFVSNAATILLVLVTAVAVLLDGEALVGRARRLVPPENCDRADEIGRIVYQSIARYFAGSVSVALLNWIVVLIGGAAAGVPGALVATPLIGAVKSVWMSTHGSSETESDGAESDDDSTALSRLLHRLGPS